MQSQLKNIEQRRRERLERQLREEQQERIAKLQAQSQLETTEQEMTATREQSVEGRLREEQQKFSELQSQLETNQQETRDEQQRVTELQRQLATREQEMTAMREQLEGRLKEGQQQVTELQSQLETHQQEMTIMREQLEGHLRVEQQQVAELQSQLETNQQEMRDEQQQVTELQRQLETREQEMTAVREQLEGRLREGQQQVAGLQSQLETHQQEMTIMREQLEGQLRQQVAVLQRQSEGLKRQQQRATELQRQLETREQEMTAMREQLEGRLREEQQQVSGLQSQLETNQQETTTMREQLEVRLREEQQQVAGLQRQLETYEQEMTTVRDQPREIEQNRNLAAPECNDPRDWVIYRHEIRITSELGRGAWGIVYQGTFHGCDVAVKEMHEALIDSDYNRKLFEREVEIASKCRHPCLLQFIGATTDGERPLLVTEILDCSLRTRLYNEDEPPLSSAEVCVVSVDVAKALNYLHQKREPIIHHDVSSGNVLLWRQGNQWRAKVADYGTANFVRQSKVNYAGAAIYCAPESLSEDPDQPISCKVDVYSFGVLLCEMCIRQQPDPQQRENQITRMRTPKFENLVRCCVTTEPWERPNMESVIKELEKPASSC